MASTWVSKFGLGLTATGVAFVGLNPSSASAESRSWAVSSLTQAVYSEEGDCPSIAIDQDAFARKQLTAQGRSLKEIDMLMDGVNADGTKDGNGYGGGHGTGKVHYMLIDRARKDGKPVNVYQYPSYIADPQVPTVTGKHAYGFNLDGKGAASPNSFEDPDTHEKGINNQYFRAMGCLENHRGSMKVKQTYWNYVWDAVRYAMPAWIITVNAADLSKDGDATVTVERALDHVEQDANSGTRTNFTFRIDPDKRFQKNVYPAKIKNGVVETTVAGPFRMNADPYVITEWKMQQTHLRLTMKADGTLDGVLGGYMPWYNIYYAYAHTGESGEMSFGIDMPGVYYNLRKHADANPDPKTGQNRDISVAFRVEGVPAFVEHPVQAKAGNKKISQAAPARSPTTVASRD